MKTLLVLMTFGLSSFAFANQTVCTGHAWVYSAFFPAPLYRAATVTISPSLADLQNGASAQVTIDSGGDPIDYQGTLDLTGAKEQKITYSNGDIFTFTVKASDSHLSLDGKFTDSNLKSQGGVKASSLSCQ